MIDYAAAAARLVGDPYTTSFGVDPDYSPASLVTLDAFVDEEIDRIVPLSRDGP